MVYPRDNSFEIDIKQLQDLPNTKALLFELLYPYGFTDFKAIATILESEVGKKVLSKQYVLLKDRNHLVLTQKEHTKDSRVFLIDASPFADDEDLSEKESNVLKDFNRVFINPQIIKEEGEEWIFNEGCLSIPDVREDVLRKEKITIEYEDENFKKHTEVLDGLAARVFQHEYDHIEGILFTDKLSTLKKRIIKKKLENISKGKIKADYRMRFPNIKKGK